MKIQSSKGKAHISVNPRGTGSGVVIQQGLQRVLLSPEEWQELRTATDALIEAQKPRKRYRMA